MKCPQIRLNWFTSGPNLDSGLLLPAHLEFGSADSRLVLRRKRKPFHSYFLMSSEPAGPPKPPWPEGTSSSGMSNPPSVRVRGEVIWGRGLRGTGTFWTGRRVPVVIGLDILGHTWFGRVHSSVGPRYFCSVSDTQVTTASLLKRSAFLGSLLFQARFWEVLLKSAEALIPLCRADPPSFARSIFSLRFLLPTVACWHKGRNPWIVIIPSKRRSNTRWKAVDLGAPGPGL